MFITLHGEQEKQRGKQHISNKIRAIMIDDIIHHRMRMREAGWSEQHTQSYGTDHNCTQQCVCSLHITPNHSSHSASLHVWQAKIKRCLQHNEQHENTEHIYHRNCNKTHREEKMARLSADHICVVKKHLNVEGHNKVICFW